MNNNDQAIYCAFEVEIGNGNSTYVEGWVTQSDQTIRVQPSVNYQPQAFHFSYPAENVRYIAPAEQSTSATSNGKGVPQDS